MKSYQSRIAATDGGLPACRAVLHWAWRLFRREWRQQALVLALLTVAVAAAIGGASAAYTLAPLGFAPGRFGAANQAFVLSGADPQVLESHIAVVEAWYGSVDVIGHRSVPIPGSGINVEIRAQDPQGVYSAPMLALLEGRYPIGADEIAVTDGVAETFDVESNSQLVLAGNEWAVVGLVENPSNLRDEFILVPPAHAAPSTRVTVLARGTSEHFWSFPWPEGGGIISHEMIEGPANVQALSAGAALGAAAVAMALVSLVGTAGFMVVARRRQRQLGMLAAIGATEKHLRLVMLANGAIVGAVAAAVGAMLGLVSWIAVVPYLEVAVVGARINRSDILPWWLIVAGMLLSVFSATAAAWWPARAVAHLPIVAALSGRLSPLPPVGSSAKRASLALTGGLTCLALANTAPPSGWINTLLIGIGTFAAICGMLLLSPLAIHMLAAASGRLPVGVRLALRDLARYQTRSAAVLAAISLSLGIASAIILIVTRTERTARLGNLSDSQLVVTEEGSRIRELVTVRTRIQVERLRAQAEQIAGALGEAQIIALQMAVDPQEAANPGGRGNTWRHAVEIGEGVLTANPEPLFVATPDLLSYYGIDPTTIDPQVDVLTVRAGEVGFRRGIEEELLIHVERLDVPAYTSAPTSLITLSALERRGWEAAHAGWLIAAPNPIAGKQLAAAREVAESAYLIVESRDGVNLVTLRSLRTGAMTAGIVAAVSILALTVGLLRSEGAQDLRILTATGATGSIRRTLSAATAGGLALLGVLLGIAGAYLMLMAGFLTEFDSLSAVPLYYLSIVALGVPLTAAVTGWLLGGQQPSALARTPIE